MAEKSRVYQRYQWLIDLIQRSGGITFEEIDKAWRRSSMNANPYSPLSERTFHRHKNDIEEIFGIFHGEGPAETVILKVANHQVKYFDSLPLHKTQRKMTEKSEKNYTYYEYRMSPAYDLVQHICSNGGAVEVIEPQSLRDMVADEVMQMYKLYK